MKVGVLTSKIIQNSSILRLAISTVKVKVVEETIVEEDAALESGLMEQSCPVKWDLAV
jgi:hypothetical protein